jgi:hypothetical protein
VPTGDARTLTHFGFLYVFEIMDAGKYRRPVAGRTAGLIKLSEHLPPHPPVGDGHPNIGHSMSGTSDVANSCLRARFFALYVIRRGDCPVRRAA